MKRIIIVSNSLWNINQFRKNLIIYLLDNDFKILIISPNYEKIKLEITNDNLSYKQIDFSPNSYFNIKDLFFIMNYRKIIFSFKPHYVLSFTVKPNLICSYLSRFYMN